MWCYNCFINIFKNSLFPIKELSPKCACHSKNKHRNYKNYKAQVLKTYIVSFINFIINVWFVENEID